ncbi:uncharacterized protein LOC126188792 [Schistocerca cancellata]|uniref:uncharacterized protein LOC126188792 n=1 Tax=Schistocerca cancellata TaxID=274614 RepID=UPI0021194506|nr:uncharacterized protein LOC126188792 [Schistocerca cancellata]
MFYEREKELVTNNTLRAERYRASGFQSTPTLFSVSYCVSSASRVLREWCVPAALWRSSAEPRTAPTGGAPHLAAPASASAPRAAVMQRGKRRQRRRWTQRQERLTSLAPTRSSRGRSRRPHHRTPTAQVSQPIPGSSYICNARISREQVTLLKELRAWSAHCRNRCHVPRAQSSHMRRRKV